MGHVPSGPRIMAGASIWISKRSRPAGRPRASSNASHASTITATCSTAETLGRVSTSPSGSPSSLIPASVSPPSRTRVLRNRSRVRSPRARVAASKHLKRMPAKAGAGAAPLARFRANAATVWAARTASASSSASGRSP